MKTLLSLLMLLIGLTAAEAQVTCPTLPYNLANGQTADGGQTQANFQYLLSCLNNVVPSLPSQIPNSYVIGNFSGVIAAPTSNLLPAATKNRIINGDMRLSQRGASFTTPASAAYTLDRWQYYAAQASKFTVRQYVTNTDPNPPAVFDNSMVAVVASSYTPVSTDYFLIQQTIEGSNFADLAWGTPSAQSVGLSFQVYSPLTGTFGGSICNQKVSAVGGTPRCYVFSYMITQANTWTPVSIIIPGDTNTAWSPAVNATMGGTGIGAILSFGLGAGTSFKNTAGAWYGAEYLQPTGSVNIVANTGAYLDITGVQLEPAGVTSFERLTVQQEILAAQRYFECSYNFGVVPGTATNNGMSEATFNPSGTLKVNGSAATLTSTFSLLTSVYFKVKKRLAPVTITTYSPNSGTSGKYYNSVESADQNPSPTVNSDSGFTWTGTNASAESSADYQMHWCASAEY